MGRSKERCDLSYFQVSQIRLTKPYHFMVDYIPLKVYRNSDANSIGFTFVHEDVVFGSCGNLDASVVDTLIDWQRFIF